MYPFYHVFRSGATSPVLYERPYLLAIKSTSGNILIIKLHSNVLLVRGNIRNQIEYTVTYPIEIGLGNYVIITVKGHVKTGPVSSLKDFRFYNPSNGSLVSETDNITTGNPNVRVQEFVFRPPSRGQLKIYTNEAILGNDHITVNIQ